MDQKNKNNVYSQLLVACQYTACIDGDLCPDAKFELHTNCILHQAHEELLRHVCSCTGLVNDVLAPTRTQAHPDDVHQITYQHQCQ